MLLLLLDAVELLFCFFVCVCVCVCVCFSERKMLFLIPPAPLFPVLSHIWSCPTAPPKEKKRKKVRQEVDA